MSLDLAKDAKVGPEVVCQSCGANGLESLLDLGYQPLCNDYLPANDAPTSRTFYPLCVYYCRKCSLAQLGYVIPTEDTFGEQYTYLTGTSRSLVDYYTKLASSLTQRLGLKPGDAIVEMGSNDGTFLKAFQDLGMNVLGVEGAPAATAASSTFRVPATFTSKITPGSVCQKLYTPAVWITVSQSRNAATMDARSRTSPSMVRSESCRTSSKLPGRTSAWTS